MADPVPMTKRVTATVTNLAVTRNGNSVKASWKIPARMTDDQRSDRASWLDANCNFVQSSKSKGPKEVSGEVWDPQGAYPGPPEKLLSDTSYDYNWVKGLGLQTSFEKPYDRTAYHPVSPGRYLDRVDVAVHGGNGSGVGGSDPHNRQASGRGPDAKASYVFKAPRAPSVKLSYDNGKFTAVVETDAGADERERYDTHILAYSVDRSGNTTEYPLDRFGRNTTTSTKWTATYDLSALFGALGPGEKVTFGVQAYARGLAGDSPTASESMAVGYPKEATVDRITCSSKDAAGVVRVAVTVDPKAQTVQLQRRAGETGSWSNVSGAKDDGNCKALYDNYAAADPAPGVKTYYRVVSTLYGFNSYSKAAYAEQVFTAKPVPTCSADIGFTSLSPNQAGDACAVEVGFTDYTANGGTELSYSDKAEAWNSTSGPTVVVDKLAGNGSAASGGRYARRQSITVDGLSSGVTYYLRGRRYRDVDGERVYSGYSATMSFTTQSAANDEAAVIGYEPEDYGTTAKLTIGINEDNPNTGTIVTYSDYRNAWESSDGPGSFEATWDRFAHGADGWAYGQVVYIRNLEPGTTYYVRVQRFLDPVSGSRTVGKLSKVYSFTTPSSDSAVSLACGIVSAVGGADGTSAAVTVGWSGDRDGTEITWSADPDAWTSNKKPSSFKFSWADGEPASPDWAHTGTAILAGLKDGQTLYARARTYVGDVYSGYSEAVEVTPYSAPANVVLTAPESVARGDAIDAWWTLESGIGQTEWHVHEDGFPFVSIAEGEGSLCYARIAPERYGDAGSVTFYVEAGCGGGLTASNSVTVSIADVPWCEVSLPGTLDAQPLSFTVRCDGRDRLLATCRSLGISQQMPDGPRDQLYGDVVWTQALDPDWHEATWADTDYRAELEKAVSDAQDALEALEDGDDDTQAALDELAAAEAALAAHPADGTVYEAEVELPMGVAFVDGGCYRVSVNAVESVAGLASPGSSADFSVEWAHQAPAPSALISVDPDAGSLTADISFAAPAGASATDVYDVYRRTPDGYALVASGIAMDSDVTDPWAPFGSNADLHYRICTRTADGDVEFADFPYTLDHDGLRFDWEGGSFESDVNVEVNDSYVKGFEARKHLDGTVNGYFDGSVAKSGTYGTAVVDLFDLGQLEAARRLGGHAGAVFCRTSEGMAFQCNVDVEVGRPRRSAIATVGLGITQMRMTDEFSIRNGRGGGA